MKNTHPRTLSLGGLMTMVAAGALAATSFAPAQAAETKPLNSDLGAALPNPLPPSASLRVMDQVVVDPKTIVRRANRDYFEIKMNPKVDLSQYAIDGVYCIFRRK